MMRGVRSTVLPNVPLQTELKLFGVDKVTHRCENILQNSRFFCISAVLNVYDASNILSVDQVFDQRFL